MAHPALSLTRINESRLLLLQHTKNLEDSSRANQMYKEQTEYGFHSLVAECGKLLMQGVFKTGKDICNFCTQL